MQHGETAVYLLLYSPNFDGSVLQTLEEKDREVNVRKDNMLREQRYLKRRLEVLSSQVDSIYKRRSVSECSTSTVSSNHSSNSESGR